jgi:hypothetical protein
VLHSSFELIGACTVLKLSALQDAIFVSEACPDRGFGRCTANHSYKGQLEQDIDLI